MVTVNLNLVDQYEVDFPFVVATEDILSKDDFEFLMNCFKSYVHRHMDNYRVPNFKWESLHRQKYIGFEADTLKIIKTNQINRFTKGISDVFGCIDLESIRSLHNKVLFNLERKMFNIAEQMTAVNLAMGTLPYR